MPSEYFKLLDFKDPNSRTLRVNRIVMIDFNHYYTLDYYPDVNGKPLLLIVKKGGVAEKNKQFPPIDKILPIYREVTNEPSYLSEKMARLDYKMPHKDVEATIKLRIQFSGKQSSTPGTFEIIDDKELTGSRLETPNSKKENGMNNIE